LDDVIIFGVNFNKMVENLRKVLLRLSAANLKINPKKYVLFSKSVKYLGHVISTGGVTTNPEKIVVVRD